MTSVTVSLIMTMPRHGNIGNITSKSARCQVQGAQGTVRSALQGHQGTDTSMSAHVRLTKVLLNWVHVQDPFSLGTGSVVN